MINLSAFRSLLSCTLLSAFMLLIMATQASATTAIMITDEDLIVGARAIVRGRVTRIESRYGQDNRTIYTYITLRVRRVYKGEIKSDEIVLRRLGGMVGDRGLLVPGAADFTLGEEVLLHLNTAEDGALEVAYLFMGKYGIERNSNGRLFVRRDIKGVKIIDNGNRGPITNEMELDQYQARLLTILAEKADRVAEIDRMFAGRPFRTVPPEYTPSRNIIKPQFNTFGQPVRWFEPDSNGPIIYRLNSDNSPAAGGGLNEFALGLAAWTNVASSGIVLQSAGSTTSCGFTFGNGSNDISFNDCRNQVPDPTGSSVILAQAQVAFTSESKMINGVNFGRIVESDIVFNNNQFISSLSNPVNLAEVMTHEIGHSIGLDHSGDNNATMAAIAHFDNRGSTLTADDQNGVTFIYPSASAPASDFSVTATPNQITLGQSASSNVTINTQGMNGFTGMITFSAAIAPNTSGVNAAFSNSTVAAGGNTMLTVTTSGTAAPGTATITVTGTSGSIARTTTITVNVTGSDFTLSFMQSSANLIPGGNANLTLRANAVGNFTQPISITATITPALQTVNATPAANTVTAGGSVMINVSALATATAGTFQLTITGTSGSLVRTATAVINVGDFALTVLPPIQSVPPGMSASFSISARALGVFNQPISISAMSSPSSPNVTMQLSSNTVLPGDTITLNVNTTNMATPGLFVFTLTGRVDSLVRTATASINIADFSLQIAPNMQSIRPGASAVFTLNTRGLGDFTSAINLRASVDPGDPNVMVQLTETRVGVGDNVMFSVTTTDRAPSATYTITITGSAGVLTRTATATLVVAVNDFNLSLDPPNQSVASGQMARFTLNARALGSFADTINLAAAVAPANSNATATLSANSIAPGGNITVTVNTSANTPSGLITITITGTAGQLVRTSTATLNVTAPPPDFAIAFNALTQTIRRGETANLMVAANGLNGFNQPINLTMSVAPADGTVTGMLSTNSVTSGGSAMFALATIDNGRVAPSVTYTVTITGTSGSIVRTATANITVNAGPFIGNATFDGKKMLTITGARFGSNARVLINNVDRSKQIKASSDTSLSLKGKAKKLGLVSGDNEIVVIDANGSVSNRVKITL